MNTIDGVKTFTFKTAYELADWINANIANPIRQEQLMQEGIDHYKSFRMSDPNDCYQITVELPFQLAG